MATKMGGAVAGHSEINATGQGAAFCAQLVDVEIDPETGFNFDDTKRYIDGSTTLSEADKQAIFEDNTRRVFSRM